MTTSIHTPQTRCRAAIARCDTTPPIGIYHRMWGAATHERATGVHRPLIATLLWLEPETGDAGEALVIVALDHCILDGPDIEQMQNAVAEAAGLRVRQVLVTLAHTHAAGLMSRSRADQPGGKLIGPYLDNLATQLGKLAAEAAVKRRLAMIVYGRGQCSLAANRDFFDSASNQFVCGLNASGPADDTMLVAKIVGDDGGLVGSIVNYACHPTTLAWQNTLISSDYVGALRETMEQHTGAPCVFLQGASADLGPREGFVGDTAIADRNGRQLGFASLAALEGLPQPGSRFVYAGPVVSGATIGTWRHEPLEPAAAMCSAIWQVAQWHEQLAYRPEWPTIDDAQAELAHWQREEATAEASGDSASARDIHAHIERATRQLWKLNSLPPDRFPMPITAARLGDALWLFVAGEHYQELQTTLRQRFPQHPIVVATLTDGWQPGYIPPAGIYGRGIYQEQIAIVAAGSAEVLLASIEQRLKELSAI